MNIEIEVKDDLSDKYVRARNNASLVIQYLEKLGDTPPNKVVNDESIRLLIESLTIMGKIYMNGYDLPIRMAEMQLENHIQKVEIKRLNKEIERLIKLKL